MIMPCDDLGGYRKFGYKVDRKSKTPLFHLGHDFKQPAGTRIKAVLDGEIIYSSETSGFGSYGKKGGVILIRHKNKLGHHFVALYGHIIRHVDINRDDIKEGEIIGTLIKYETNNFRADHLHFGINLMPTVPSFAWGYDEKLKDWVDPVHYLKTYC